MDCGVGKFKRRCDQGYSAALGTCVVGGPRFAGRFYQIICQSLPFGSNDDMKRTPPSDSDRSRRTKPGPGAFANWEPIDVNEPLGLLLGLEIGGGEVVDRPSVDLSIEPLWVEEEGVLPSEV